MRRLLFVVAIIVVLAVIGLYTTSEFSTPEITFVNDNETKNPEGNELVVRRLYTSGVDVDAFFKELEEKLISAEFTDEEISEAALKSGTPEFYPAFYFNISKPDITKDVFGFSCLYRQEMTAEQVDNGFKIANLNLEMTAEGLQISNVKLSYPSSSKNKPAVPVIAEDGSTMQVSLYDTPALSMSLDGRAGMITLNYTYDVVTNNIFSTTVLEDQLLTIYANISYLENGTPVVEYIREPYSSLEDLGL